MMISQWREAKMTANESFDKPNLLTVFLIRRREQRPYVEKKKSSFARGHRDRYLPRSQCC